jgi:hypothetical protein
MQVVMAISRSFQGGRGAARLYTIVFSQRPSTAGGVESESKRSCLQQENFIMPKMSISDLKSMLAAEKADALAAISAARLAEERADAMDYYLGNMRKDMAAQDGRSRAVSTDVADTIEGLIPQLMDIFAGSDEVVRFEPVGPEDEAAATQETDYVNHVFMQQNPGFMTLYSFIKDALLSKVGIVKVWWEEREEESRETYYDLTEDQFALLAQAVLESDGAMKVVAHTAHDAIETTESVSRAS